MDIEGARAFLRDNYRAVLVTRRSDGGLQTSPIMVGLDDHDRAVISSSEDRAKVGNLRRDPRATLCVLNDGFWGAWAHVEGTAEIVSLPDAMTPLIEYYRGISGEHPDWDDYRAAMERERRCLIRITIDRTAGP